jgi:hypothetical protein
MPFPGTDCCSKKINISGLELLDDCLQHRRKKRVTFLCGDGGALAIGAATSKSEELVHKLLRVSFMKKANK